MMSEWRKMIGAFLQSRLLQDNSWIGIGRLELNLAARDETMERSTVVMTMMGPMVSAMLRANQWSRHQRSMGIQSSMAVQSLR
jgi:hypothetical protein